MTRTPRRHSRGLLDLCFARADNGRTYLRRRRHAFPLRTTVPLYLDPGDPGLAYVYVQNPTGGIFADDVLVTEVEAEPATRVHLTSQSATKIYRMDSGSAVGRYDIRLGEGAYLEYLPDQLVPQAGCAYEQRTTVDVAAEAVFVGSEIVAPGRVARGEWFEYERLMLRTEVTRAGRTLCVDALRFDPRASDPGTAGLLDDGDYVANLLVVAPEVDVDALEARLEAGLTAETSAVGAAGTLPGGAGVYVRLVASSGPAVRAALGRAVSAARMATLGIELPEARK